jgi:hypothetical protein
MTQFTVAAWGAGVNSTAMIVEWLKRGRKLDIALFADTGGERPETYAYRDTFAAWLKERGVPFFTVRGNYKYETLEAECLGNKTLPSIAYGFKTCSQKWKRSPQDIFLNNYEPAQQAWGRGEKVLKLIGYDAGETRRAKIIDEAKYEVQYPLIEWDIDRDGCIKSIVEAGLAVPPKSACFFCPSSRGREILDLAEKHPDLMKRALAIEANAETYHIKGLGRNFSWAIMVEQDRRQGKLFDGPQIACDCFDGEEP